MIFCMPRGGTTEVSMRGAVWRSRGAGFGCVDGLESGCRGSTIAEI